jgi:sugar phosphate isomerase/epimerase
MGRENFAVQLPEVMRQISEIGFRGFETALDVLPLTDPTQFQAAREEAGGIELTAAHAGGIFWGSEAPAQVDQIVSLAEKLPELGCGRLMVSLPPAVAELAVHDLADVVMHMDALGARLRAAGVEVALHNHAHEFVGEGRVLNAIVAGADPANVKLGADLGWVAYAGWDPVEFLQAFGERVSYLHVRDLRIRDNTKEFVEVGQGDFNWPAIRDALQRLSYQGWLVAESEFTPECHGQQDARATAALQLRGLQAIFSSASPSVS